MLFASYREPVTEQMEEQSSYLLILIRLTPIMISASAMIKG
jgi:hypothetical protein